VPHGLLRNQPIRERVKAIQGQLVGMALATKEWDRFAPKGEAGAGKVEGTELFPLPGSAFLLLKDRYGFASII
jgi:hypothetical protein